MNDILQNPVGPRDHLRGADGARVQLVEYADFACPYCAAAEPVVRQLLALHRSELCCVYRHNPRGELHEGAHLAACAAEAAARQGQFWPMHDMLFEQRRAVNERGLVGAATALGLDIEVFRSDLHSHAVAARVREDEVSGLRSGVIGTPTFFVNGTHFRDKPDLDGLGRAIVEALRQSLQTPTMESGANRWISS